MGIVVSMGCAGGDAGNGMTTSASGANGQPQAIAGMGAPIAGGTAGTGMGLVPQAGTGVKATGASGTGAVGPSAGSAGTGALKMMGASAGTGSSMMGTAGGAGTSAGMGSAGMMASAGTGAGTAGTGSSGMGKGTCCPDGNCLCHGDVPSQLTSAMGPYQTATIPMQAGTAYYPTNADPPFAALSICPGFLNTGPEMTPWGPFYASYGIVTVVTNTGAADLPDVRAGLLLGAIEELKKLNSDSSSPLSGKLSGRYGTSGYSMGGGGTTIAATQTASLNSSIGLAAWGGDGTNDKVPELLFCGDADVVAPCNMSDGVYAGIPDATPKMEIVVPGATHFNWFDPTDAGGGESGKYGLAFEKVYLEGDTRWKPLLLSKPPGGSVQTNIN